MGFMCEAGLTAADGRPAVAVVFTHRPPDITQKKIRHHYLRESFKSTST